MGIRQYLRGRRELAGEKTLSKMSRGELALHSRVPGTKERKFIEMRLGVPVHKFADYSSYLETGYKRVWATYRACRLISSTVASATYRVMEKGATEADKSAGWFIDQPNPYDSWREMIEMWAFHIELTGNAFWLKDEPDMLGRPKHLYPLLPQHVQIVPDEDHKVSHYIYRVSGQQIRIERDEMIHFRRVHPNSLHLGLGSIEAAEDLYESFINRNTLDEKFMANGAQLSGVMSREDVEEQVDEGVWEKFKAKFNAEYAGKKNAGKTAFLNGKWSFHQLGMTMKEMQSLEREKWTVEEIFMNHGIPLSVAGVDGASNYATAHQDEINFKRYTCLPLIRILADKINGDGFIQATAGGPSDKTFNFELSGVVDVEQIQKDYGPMLKDGVITRNEMRELAGLEPVDNELMDQFYVSQGVVPLELAGAMANPSQEEIRRTIDSSRLDVSPPTPEEPETVEE